MNARKLPLPNLALLSSLALIIAFSAIILFPRASQADDVPIGVFRPGDLIIVFDESRSPEETTVRAGPYLLRIRQRIDPINCYVVEVPVGKEPEIRNILLARDDVVSVEYNFFVQSRATVPAEPSPLPLLWGDNPIKPLFAWANDAMFPEQWNLSRIQAPQGWDITTGSAVVIATLGTGVDFTHPDLMGKVLPGINLLDRDAPPLDDGVYGTFEAGIAAAVTNNGQGIAGTSWGAHILPVKVLGPDGTGLYGDIIEGIVWAAEHGADVISMSFWGTERSEAMQQAVNHAVKAGAVLIASAGGNANEGNPPVYPAALDNVLGVTATNEQDIRFPEAGYNSSTEFVDVAAPGGKIWSTVPQEINGGWARGSGVGFAVPHVAGVVALMRSVNPSLTASQVATILKHSASDMGSRGPDPYFGYGLVNADAALKMTPHYLQVGPERLIFRDDGTRITPPVAYLRNETTSARTWIATTDADWLELSEPMGTTPSIVEVRVKRAPGAGCGIQTAEIQARSLYTNAVNSPRIITVQLRSSSTCLHYYLPFMRISGR